MAPRTPAQQAAYNEKRRKEAADAKARKAAADASVKAIKAERKAEKAKAASKPAVVVKKGDKLDPPKAMVAKSKHNVAAQVKALGADSLLPPEPRKVGKSPALAAPFKGKGKPMTAPERDDDDPPPLAIPEKKDPKAPKPQGPAGPSTIARSYQREFKGTGATKRGNMLQVTVTFTEAQFTTLKQRAELYQCSLAETIRKCVIAGPNLADTKPRSE